MGSSDASARPGAVASTVDTPEAAPAGSAGRGRGWSAPARWALLLGALGVLFRVVLLAWDTPPANSDEATAGLAALHIWQGRHFPVFFYGQQYMGTLHSYLSAPLVGLLGTTWWAVRLPALLMYALLLVAMYRLTAALYPAWFAAGVVGLFALGSDRLVKNELVGAGGYSDVATATAALMLVAVLLATGRLRRRPLGHAVWGLLAGYVTWTHWLALPYVAVSGWLLLRGRGRDEVRGRTGGLLAAGFLLGCAPLLWHNLTGGRNSLSVFLSLSGAAQPAPWADRLSGAVLTGLPLSSGLCAPGDCRPWQLWWGPVYLVLLALAGLAAVRRLRPRSATGGSAAPPVDRPADAGGTPGGRPPASDPVAAGRLALVAGAALTLLAYAVSASAATSPMESARYLHYGLVSLPAVLWPLCRCAAGLVDPRRVVRAGRGPGARSDRPSAGAGPRPRASGAVAGALVLALFVVDSVVATGQLVGYRGTYRRRAADERVLVDHLLGRGLLRVYAGYWTCNRLSYLTAERVRCAVVDEDLSTGFDRYLPYRADVAAADRVAYVLTLPSEGEAAMAERVRRAGERPVVTDVAGYRVYAFDHQVPPVG
jgi:hypothetical protein